MLISETKIDGSFPNSIFTIDGFTRPYRKDRTNMGGGINLHVRYDIPSKELKAISLSNDKEYIFIGINLYKEIAYCWFLQSMQKSDKKSNNIPKQKSGLLPITI